MRRAVKAGRALSRTAARFGRRGGFVSERLRQRRRRSGPARNGSWPRFGAV